MIPNEYVNSELSDLEKMLEHMASYSRWKHLSLFLFISDFWFLVALALFFHYDSVSHTSAWFVATLALLAFQLWCSLQADRQKRLFEKEWVKAWPRLN